MTHTPVCEQLREARDATSAARPMASGEGEGARGGGLGYPKEHERALREELNSQDFLDVAAEITRRRRSTDFGAM